MAHFVRELGWVAERLGHIASFKPGGARKAPEAPERGPGVPLVDTEWKSFDLADAMEAGMARELTASFTMAPPREQVASRLVVERSEDRSRNLLKTEDGEPLLLAVCDEDDLAKLSMYVPTGGADVPVALGPAFRLEAEDDDLQTWSLTTDRCEGCPKAGALGAKAGAKVGGCRQELARITHSRKDFGSCSLITMDVELPTLRPDGSPSPWCSGAHGARGRQRPSERLLLESRSPRWSKRLKTLSLDFHGRCSQASVQNFQLDLAPEEEDPNAPPQTGTPELLFGQTGRNRYVLDYKHPLGMAQAFAIALTTNLFQ